jgi:hypothetical protein
MEFQKRQKSTLAKRISCRFRSVASQSITKQSRQSNLTFPTRCRDKDNQRPWCVRTQEPVVDKLKMKTLTIRGQVEGHRGLSKLHKYLPSALPTTMTLLLLPSHPAKKKRKKRKKPSERSAQENLEAMRESRARNLPPSSDEDDDLHKNPSALDLGVFTQYSADQDDVSDGDGGDSSPSNGSSGSAVNANNILASNQDTSSSNNSHGSDAQGNELTSGR